LRALRKLDDRIAQLSAGQAIAANFSIYLTAEQVKRLRRAREL
jgi:hypothetical protein